MQERQGDGPLIFGIGETLDRRRGPRISDLGVYRDAVRSISCVVKTSGLCWVSLMWLGHIPWAKGHWALPFLTALAPSERYYRKRSRSHKKLTGWARQMILQPRRWLSSRPLVLVGDSGYAVLDLLHFCQSLREPVALMARLRLDAGLYAPAAARRPGQNGRPRVKGSRLPTLKELPGRPALWWTTMPVPWCGGSARTLELASQTAVRRHSGRPPVPIRWVLLRDPRKELASQALLCASAAVPSERILEWFVLRWQLGVACQEARDHLGVETQRQWSGRVITRTTPVLMGMSSWITLAAHSLQKWHPPAHRQAARYAKSAPAFADAIALLRRHLWIASEGFSTSPLPLDTGKVPTAFYDS